MEVVEAKNLKQLNKASWSYGKTPMSRVIDNTVLFFFSFFF